MNKKPKSGTYGAITRSTEEEHQAFRKSLNGLFFTREEFLEHGPAIVMIKAKQVMDELRKQEKSK